MVAEIGSRTRQELKGAALAQLRDPREEVIMLMRVGGVADAQAGLLRIAIVLIAVAADIEHHCIAGLLGANQVRGVCS